MDEVAKMNSAESLAVRETFSRVPEMMARFKDTLVFKGPKKTVERAKAAGRYCMGADYQNYMKQLHRVLAAEARSQDDAVEFLLETVGPDRLHAFMTMVYGKTDAHRGISKEIDLEYYLHGWRTLRRFEAVEDLTGIAEKRSAERQSCF